MKKLATIIALMLSISAYTQIVVYASQDARLAILGDDKGNEAFTPNLNFGVELRQNNGSYDVIMKPDIEYAGLASGEFVRYSANFGINFKEWLNNFEFTSTAGYGVIHRFGMAYTGFGANFQTTYKLTNKLGIYLDAEFLQRNDLQTPEIRFSGKIGIKIWL